ncbi:MAG: transposase [Acidobacteria bacterium]|nr:transposase [Acidobacteriota bacterium]
MTLCSHKRTPLFADPTVADLLVDCCSRIFSDMDLELTVYCVMPDHLHLLLTSLDGGAEIRQAIERLKQAAGFVHRRISGQPLWQRSFFDYTLRSDDARDPVIAYIVNNPMRAGLVTRPEHWPFWGSTHWSREDLLETIAAVGPGRRPG